MRTRRSSDSSTTERITAKNTINAENTITNITQEGVSTNSMNIPGGQGGRFGGRKNQMKQNANGQIDNQINSQLIEQ